MPSALFLRAMKALCGVLSRQHIVRSELDAIPETFVIDGWDVHTFPVERSFFHICNKSIGLLRYNEHKTPFLVLFTLLLQCRLYPANIPICVAVTDRAAHIKRGCALPGFVDSKNEEKTERNAGYLVVSHSGGGMLRQGTRKGIRRTPANRGMRAHRIVKSLDISEDVCHGLCP